MFDDSFFNQHAFIRLSWCLYFKGQSTNSSDFQLYYSEVDNLIKTTALNRQLLAHSLYYLYLLIQHKTSLFPNTSGTYSSFQTSSRVKLLSGEHRRNSKELKELIIVLLMISNKSHDDSSYTMKTWENLTTLTIPILKKREITILKKINYNVFLSPSHYSKWLDVLYNQCIKFSLVIDPVSPKSAPTQQYPPIYNTSSYIPSSTPSSDYNESYPLTPRSPLLDINYQIQSLKRPLNDPVFIQPQGKRQRLSTLSTSYLLTPIKSLQLSTSNNLPSQHHSSKTHNITSTIASMNDPYLEYPSLQQFNYQPTSLDNVDNNYPEIPLLQQPHPINCTCCAMTNLANGYNSSYTRSNNLIGGNPNGMRSML